MHDNQVRHVLERYLGALKELQASNQVDEFGYDPHYARVVRPLTDFLYDTWWRIDVEGAEHLPDKGPGMLVANHLGALPVDGWMLMEAVWRHTQPHRLLRPLVEDAAFYLPFLGVLLNRTGGVWASRVNAERLLAQDDLIAVFPEGVQGIGKVFREQYKLQYFGRGGFARLALRTGTPLIPVAIASAEEINPMLGMLPLPAKWRIRIGPPIEVDTARTASEADPALVGHCARQVRDAIQEMIDELVARHRSLLFG